MELDTSGILNYEYMKLRKELSKLLDVGKMAAISSRVTVEVVRLKVIVGKLRGARERSQAEATPRFWCLVALHASADSTSANYLLASNTFTDLFKSGIARTMNCMID
jgi:hypothetical protein